MRKAGFPCSPLRRGRRPRARHRSISSPPSRQRDRHLIAASMPSPSRDRHLIAASMPSPSRDRHLIAASMPSPPHDRHLIAASMPSPPHDRHLIAASMPSPPRDRDLIAASMPSPLHDRDLITALMAVALARCRGSSAKPARKPETPSPQAARFPDFPGQGHEVYVTHPTSTTPFPTLPAQGRQRREPEAHRSLGPLLRQPAAPVPQPSLTTPRPSMKKEEQEHAPGCHRGSPTSSVDGLRTDRGPAPRAPSAR
ncbi:uncharacterized protein CMC5_008230 [Chondromyces crocatus]|uniref:Uncharacterized protein n=1 Tax=Chondromyces crocatus TaxID=52 RepID=A0A0K1E7P5_CHOCO|nr:uncharacterized protein CMC5_008230 [Chondromyces crocatus]